MESRIDLGNGAWMELSLLPGETPRGIVLVLPGGGYGGRADHEGSPVARKFNAAGFHATVVHYRVAPARFPAPQSDVFKAVETVRANAAGWRIRPDRVAVLGFSAGGHLAASTGTLFDDPAIPGDPAARRPDALILCYPVISADFCGHRGSFENLLGPEPTPAQLARVSLELRVSENTPPAFLWHTADDAAVPVENSFRFASALRRYGIPFELHVYPSGPHGLGLAEEDNEFVSVRGFERIASWSGLAAGWLEAMDWGSQG